MRIYASTACVPGNQNYMVALDRYISAGIFNIELGSSHKYFAENDPALLKEFDLNFLLHNYFPPNKNDFVLNLASSDPRIVDQSMQLIKSAITLSALLHAPFYSFHAGFVTDPYGFGTTSYLFSEPVPGEAEKVLARFANVVEELAMHAKKNEILLLIENNVCPPELQGKLLLQTPDDFIEFFHRITDDNIGILLDFGHLNVTSKTFEFDRTAFVDKLAPCIKGFHIHDNDGRSDTHQSIGADSWVLDVLKDPWFSNAEVVVEAQFQDVQSLKEHIDWLEDILDSNA